MTTFIRNLNYFSPTKIKDQKITNIRTNVHMDAVLILSVYLGAFAMESTKTLNMRIIKKRKRKSKGK